MENDKANFIPHSWDLLQPYCTYKSLFNMHLQRSLLNYKRIYSSECNNVNMQLTLEVEAMITKNLFEDAFFKLALSKIRL